MGLELADCIILANADQVKHHVEVSVLNDKHAESITKLIRLKYIDKHGKMSETAKQLASSLRITAHKLQQGIKVKGRKKTDPKAIINIRRWASVTVKKVDYACSPSFCYIGKPIRGMELSKVFVPNIKTIETLFNPPTDTPLKKAEIFAYQIEKLGGLEVIWIKAEETYIAIDVRYVDFIMDAFKGVDFYCTDMVSPIYAINKRGTVKAVVSAFDPTERLQRPNFE